MILNSFLSSLFGNQGAFPFFSINFGNDFACYSKTIFLEKRQDFDVLNFIFEVLQAPELPSLAHPALDVKFRPPKRLLTLPHQV